MAIILSSIAGVALIGILLLTLLKVLFYMKDLKEFRKFENERKKSQWAKVRSFVLNFFFFFGHKQYHKHFQSVIFFSYTCMYHLYTLYSVVRKQEQQKREKLQNYIIYMTNPPRVIVIVHSRQQVCKRTRPNVTLRWSSMCRVSVESVTG